MLSGAERTERAERFNKGVKLTAPLLKAWGVATIGIAIWSRPRPIARRCAAHANADRT